MRDIARQSNISGRCPHRRVVAQCFSYLLFVFAGFVQAAELNVPADFGSIQDAINAADAGDTIFVERGTYNEVLTLTKDNLTLRGRETAQTFINPGSDNIALSIVGVNTASFANFTVINAQTGVSVSTSNNITIANNVFDVGTSNTGVFVVNLSPNVTLDNNTFYRNGTAVSRLQIASTVRNNIFFENTTALANGGNVLNTQFNCFFGNQDSNNIGNNATEGNPLFTNPGGRDFHLQTGSACIDVGTGVDVIDNTTADAGAYGGNLADSFPFPTPQPSATDTSASATGPFNISINWTANLAYLVAGYDVYYGTARGDYNGIDADEGPSPVNAGNVTSITLTNLNPSAGNPAAPVLISVAPSNRTLTLNWSAADQATGYRVLYGVASANENSVGVGNVTSFDLRGLENGTTYLVAVQATAQQTYYLATKVYDSTAERNTSIFSTEQSLVIGPINESAVSNTMNGLPEPVMPFPTLPNEGCFIATAAYGTEYAPEITILREFRDTILLTNHFGRILVTVYYRYSPAIAEVIKNYPSLKELVRGLLLPVVLVAVFILQASTLPKLVVSVLLLSLIWRYTSRFVFRIRNYRDKNRIEAA